MFCRSVLVTASDRCRLLEPSGWNALRQTKFENRVSLLNGRRRFAPLRVSLNHDAYRETPASSEIFRCRVCVACGGGYATNSLVTNMDPMLIFYSTRPKNKDTQVQAHEQARFRHAQVRSLLILLDDRTAVNPLNPPTSTGACWTCGSKLP